MYKIKLTVLKSSSQEYSHVATKFEALTQNYHYMVARYIVWHSTRLQNHQLYNISNKSLVYIVETNML